MVDRLRGITTHVSIVVGCTSAHEARILATLVDVPALVTPEQMDRWAASFDSWDIVDGATGNLSRRLTRRPLT